MPGDFMTALLAEAALERHPGATILYDLRASRAVPDTIERAGGRAVRSRVGHAFIKVRMREEDAQFAGEVSGHYYFRDFYSVDTGIVPALVLLELVSRKGGSLAALIRPLREQYFISGEINTPVRDVALKLQELKDRFGQGAEISHLDGVSIDFPDWHFNVRPSNTEPLLRLNLEAYSQADMERHRDEVLAVISGNGERARHGGERRATIRQRHGSERKPPFRFSHVMRVGLRRDRRAGRRLLRPLHAVLRPRPGRVPAPPRAAPCRPRRPRVRDAREPRRVPRAGPLRRPARGVRAGRADRHLERRCSSTRPATTHGVDLCTAEQVVVLIDRATRRPVTVGEAYRSAVDLFEGRAPAVAPVPDDSPVSRRGGAVDAVERIVNREGEADEILRQAVATIAKRFDTFCGIRFVEDGGMIDGPSAGPFSEPRAVVAITYDDSSVAEIALGSAIAEEDRDALDRIAELLSPYCLVGWDTGGESWNP